MRYPAIDALRGAALAAMIVYHAAWDLDHFDHVDWPLYSDPGWLAFRAAILIGFIGLSGTSLILATRDGVDWPRFLRRRAWIAAAAAAITLFSLWAFPENAIWFGVLHFIAVATILVLPARHWPWYAQLLAAAAIAAATPLLRDPVFDDPWLQWIGLVTREPQSADYVPLLPWIAALLGGMAAGRLLIAAPDGHPAARPLRGWTPGDATGRAFAWSGRQSLVIYLLHQPVLVALLLFAGLFAPPAFPARFAEDFTADCRAGCLRQGGSEAQCTAYCACALDVVQRDFDWGRIRADDLTAAELARIESAARACMATEDQ